ncbi:hypothetical protein ACWDR0_23805 [Streptomyces sp. NPDC003691]
MRTTMPERVTVLRIGATNAAAFAPSRLDLSTVVGIDLDLVLGPVEGDESEAAEHARLAALVDMANAGYIPRGRGLDVIAGLAEEIKKAEDEDNARGYEPDDVFAGRWAAPVPAPLAAA